ncbi:T9SS type A sorting domain-containing protein [Ekhidna sp.]|uniref:T9SS type A sorting domain-containing protein n=1 Tax=Ekhidna sp. TaxID=2608089 RepID=UPI003B5CDC01
MISFDNGGEDPSSTLTSESGTNWPDNQTFVVTYNVADANEVLADVDVLVSGGQDLAGNAITATNTDQNDLFSINTQSPSITGVTPNIALITDSETGGTGFNITVTFDEPMIDDGSQDPVISFDNGGEDPSSTLTSESGTNWPNNQTFVVTYNVADANEAIADVDVLVSGGQNLVGNGITATNTDQNDLFSIDTQNPSITGVTPNISLIGDPNTGGTGFNITVTFDEPMIDDGSQDPVISFDNGGEDPSSTLTSESGTNWPDNQTFVVTYNVADANEVLADVDVLVSGGQDLAGNAITATNTDQNDLFSIDTQNPTFTEARSFDTNQDGSIDEIVLVFSEDIDEATVNQAHFTIDGSGASFTVDTSLPANNGQDLNLTDNLITLILTTPILGTTAKTVSYAAGTLADEAGNLAGSNAFTPVDLAPPAIISAITADDGNGEIDGMTVTFSEDIDGATLDTDGGSDDFIVTDGAYTYVVSSVAFNSPNGATITLTERGSPDTGVTPDINLGVADIEDLAVSNNSLTVAQDFTGTTDGAAPVLYDFSLQPTNAFIQVVYSETIQQVGGGTPTLGDFNENQANATAPTSVSINGINNALGEALASSEDTIQFTMTVLPVPSTYDAGDNVVIDTDGTTLEDLMGNPLGDGESTGNVQVNDVNNVVTIVDAIWVTTSAPANFEGYIELEFSDGVYGSATDKSIRLANSDNGIYEQANWTDGTALCDNNDDLCATYNANGSTVFVNSDSNDDIELRAGDNGSGGATDEDKEIRFSTNNANNITNYDGSKYRFYLNDIDNGPWTGEETYTFGPANAASGKINGRNSAATMVGSYTFVFTLPDQVAQDFGNATATAYDVDGDGNIDEVEVVMPDGIEDATVTLSDFQFNSIVPSGFDTGSTSNDDTFRLLFDSYTGTAVVGNLVYTAGTLEDDAEVLAPYLSSGNLFVGGSITPTDAAGPVILSAETQDTDLNGKIDELLITYSEPFNDIAIAAGSFTLGAPYTTDGSISFDGNAQTINLGITEIAGAGVYDTDVTFNVSVIADILEDQTAGAANNIAQLFTNTLDRAAPYSTVTDPINTTSNNPQITGFIDDINATILVSVGSNTVPVSSIDGGGNWTLNAGSLTNPLAVGSYDVILTTIDESANIGTDATSNELNVNGGVAIVAPTELTGCVGAGYQTLGTIQINETVDNGIAASGNIILSLPEGFEFDVTAFPTINITNSGITVDQETVIDTRQSRFLSTTSFSLDLDVNAGVANSEDNDITIDDFSIRAVSPASATAAMEKTGGDLAITSGTDTYATMSSTDGPSPITSLESSTDPGTPITTFSASYTPRVTINYSLGPVFTDGEDFVFSGGATGTMVSGTNTGTSFDMYLTSGTVVASETFDGQTSAASGTTTTNAVGVSSTLLPFNLIADATGNTSNWYFGDVDPTPDRTVEVNSNTDLGATSPGLYTYNITIDNSSCESAALLFNVLVYDDVHPDNDERTFVDRNFTVTDDQDTIFISKPAGHTVSLSGNGLSVQGGGSDPMLGIFNPGIAGDNGLGGPEVHPITYTVTNNTTGESETITVLFTVNPETEFFIQAPENLAVSDLPYQLNLDPTIYGPDPMTDAQYDWGVYWQWVVNDVSPFGWFRPEELGGAYPWSDDFAISIDSLDNGGTTPVPINTLGPGGGTVFRMYRRSRYPDGSQNVEYDYVFVYDVPRIEITNLSAQYCVYDDAITLNRDGSYTSGFSKNNLLDNNEKWRPDTTLLSGAITNGYLLEYSADGSFSNPDSLNFTASMIGSIAPLGVSNTFDPKNPDQDGDDYLVEDESGTYRITYFTEQVGPLNLVNSASYIFQLYPQPNPPTLDLTGNPGGATGQVATDEYLLEYCIGNPIPDFVTPTVGTITWYADPAKSIILKTGNSINALEAGLNVTAASFRALAQQSVTIYFTTTVDGCESELTQVTTTVYATPATPTITDADATLFNGINWLEYCASNGGTISPGSFEMEALGTDEEYEVVRQSYTNAIVSSSGGITGTVGATVGPTRIPDDGANPIDIPIPTLSNGDVYVYTITKYEEVNNGASNFTGCGGQAIKIYVLGFEEPTVVSAADFQANRTDFHVSEGGVLSNIVHANGLANQYTWYQNEGPPPSTVISTLGNAGSMTQAILNTATPSFVTTVGTPYQNDIYNYYVTRTVNRDLDRGFDGCESADGTEVSVTVHARQRAPQIVSDNSGIFQSDYPTDPMGSGDANFLVCIDLINPNAALKTVEDEYINAGGLESDRQFNWYQYNFGTSTRGSLKVTGDSVTFDQLDLESIGSATIISFEVVQVTDIIPGVYSGVEGESTILRVRFEEQDDLDISNLDNGDAFCTEDTDFELNLQADDGGGFVDVSDPDIIGYEIRNGATLAVIDSDYSGAAGEPFTDFQGWHETVTGNAPDANGDIVGGVSSSIQIVLFYEDPDTDCIKEIINNITIYPDPNVSLLISGNNTDDQEFCYDDLTFDILGYDVANGVAINTLTGTGSFSSNVGGGLQNVGNNQAEFTPKSAHDAFHGGASPTTPFAEPSTHRITYLFNDAQGCQRDTSLLVRVNPLPQIVDNEIKSASTCAETDIKLFVEMAPNNLGQGKDAYNFIWRVGTTEVQNLDGTAGGDTLVYNLGTLTSAQFSVVVTYIGDGNPSDYATMCQSSVIGQTITVGEAPAPSVSWVGTTAGISSGTDFRITEDNPGLPDGDVNYVEFFVNGVSQFVNTTPTFPIDYNYNPGSPGYSFGTPGSYPVRVLMRTTAGCEVDSEIEYGVRNIEIIEHNASITSYTEDFEGPHGWTIETLSLDGKENTLTTSWEIGTNVPDSTAGTTYDGANAVYTNGYQASEVSFVYSPSFDLRNINSPTVSFLRYENFDSDRDGVVFQMSVDDGRTWVNVGGFDDAQPPGLKSTPGWYNNNSILGSPGTQSPGPLSTASNPDINGWASDSDWKEAIAPLAIPVGQEEYVRFRFALGAQPGIKLSNGFAFDLLQIYEREQVVLVEQFSSTLSQSSYNINGLIDNAPIFNGNDVLRINYFTDFANNGSNKDVLNQRNVSAPGARSSYYGIENIPSVAIAGDAQLINNAAQLNGSVSAQLTNAKLVNPGFDIAINASIDAENVLTVGADFTAVSEFPNRDTKLGLFLAILEPEIVVGTDIERIGVYQNGDVITNVLRKMLPSPAGQFEQGTVAIGDGFSIEDMTWPISNMYVMDTLTVVAYVQNLNTKQILQSAVLGISNPNTELALGAEELTDFSLYPNPADKEVTVEFAEVLREQTDWVIFDQAGREVLKGQLDKGTKTMTVQTSEMPSGLYFIHLYAEDSKRQSKRIMVIH